MWKHLVNIKHFNNTWSYCYYYHQCYWEHCFGRIILSQPQTELYLPSSICDTLEVTWAQGQFLNLASWRSNGINQRSMWIFSKNIIQKEYPGSDGKQSKDPTGRTSLCLRALDCSNNFLSHCSFPHWKRLAPWASLITFRVY